MTLYSRDDWTLYRVVETLCPKAGVSPDRLKRTVLKELTDNALDASGRCAVGELDGGGFFVEDDGPGIPPDDVPKLFSLRRPLTSSKLDRLPSRGALGNGLRVVASAVLASGGRLRVHTRGRCLDLAPQDDGTTSVELDGPSELQDGLRVEIEFGANIPEDPDPLGWSRRAISMAGDGPIYRGKPSPFWEDADSFFERLQAAGDRPVRSVVEDFDGCSGKKAGQITNKLKGRAASSLNREEATVLLEAARRRARPVDAKRFKLAKQCGVHFSDAPHASARGTFAIDTSSRPPHAGPIPFTVEAWVTDAQQDSIEILVNRTPVVAEVGCVRDGDKSKLTIYGCGLCETAKVGRPAVKIIINVQTPYMPITSDGKEPNLDYMLGEIFEVVEKAARRNGRNRPSSISSSRLSQKDVILANLDDAVKKTSGGGRYRYSQRQLYYAVRPAVLEYLEVELQYDNFTRILTEHEGQRGDLPGLYRDPRGIVYHPHLHQEIPLGTLSVEEYERPEWTFNKVLYCEKEGLFPILRSEGWPEKYDCALLTSKGTPTRAARDLLDLLGETDEQITFFAIHDADAYGTTIYQALQEATAARGARSVHIVNLGLDPWEGIAMGLPVEAMEKAKKRKPVAPYVREYDDGDVDYEDWLQKFRIELNAMTTPQFITWLSQKINEHDHCKVVPPAAVLNGHFDASVEQTARAVITARILSEQDLDGQIQHTLSALSEKRDEIVQRMAGEILAAFKEDPTQWWRTPVEELANSLVKKGVP